MSANDEPDTRAGMAGAGAARYMVKDVDMAELLHTIDAAGHAGGDPTSQLRRCLPRSS